MTAADRRLRLALYQPDIPQNTGTILRMAACLGVGVDVIMPAGFDMTDRSLRRAGLDYLDHVDLVRHADWEAFRREAGRRARRLVLATTRADLTHTEFHFEPHDTLMLGRESAGVPEDVHNTCDARITIPMAAGMRSLNVAISGAMALTEALRQTGGFPAKGA